MPVSEILDIESVPVCELCGSENASLVFRVPRSEIVKCTSCGVHRLQPRVAEHDVVRLYGRNYFPTIRRSAVEKELRNPTFRHRRRLLERFTGSRTLFEIGPGDGNFLAYLRGYGWKVGGIELSPEVGQYVYEKHGINILSGSLGDIGQSSRIETIGMYHVLEHAYRPKELLTEVREILPPGGVLHIQVPNFGSYEARFFGPYWSGLRLPEHAYFYDPSSLRTILEGLGFEIRYVGTYDPWYCPRMTMETVRNFLKKKPPWSAMICSSNPTDEAGWPFVPEPRRSPMRLRARAFDSCIAPIAWGINIVADWLASGNVVNVLARAVDSGRGRSGGVPFGKGRQLAGA